MRRRLFEHFLLPLAFLAFTSCQQETNPQLAVPSDPKVLHGTWQGQAEATYSTISIVTSPDALTMYSLESGPGFTRLVARHTVTGAILHTRQLSNTQRQVYNGRALAWREDGKLIVPGVPTLELDPATLSTTGQLKAGYYVSSNGRHLYDGGRNPSAYFHGDVVADRGVLVNRFSGATVAAPAKHDNVCRYTYGIDIEHGETDDRTGNTALTYSDGYVEVRSSDDQLKAAFRVVDECRTRPQVRWSDDGRLLVWWPFGERGVAYGQWQSGETAVRNQGKVELPTRAHFIAAAPSSRGLLVSSDTLTAEVQGNEVVWQDQPPILALTVASVARFNHERAYTFEGSLQLGSGTFALKGWAYGTRVTFRPQAPPPRGVQFYGDLERDGQVVGQVVGTVSGSSDLQQPRQYVHIKLEGAAYKGVLTRP